MFEIVELWTRQFKFLSTIILYCSDFERKMEATIINDVTTYDDRLTYQELQKLCHDQVESIRTLENYMIDLESTNRILMSEVQTLKNREVIYEDEVKSLTSANIEKDEYIDYLNGILNESLEALQMMKQKVLMVTICVCFL